MHPPLVDYHCHLDLYPDHESLFEQCRGSEIEILTVTTTPRAWKKNKELAGECSNIRRGLGLHPQLVAEGLNESPLFESLLSETRFVGEVGLDASPRFYKGFEAQKRSFERVLCCCAEYGGKILSIHSVRTARESLAMIEKFLPSDKGKAILHWFTGSKSEVKRAVELGCFFSVNGEMLKRDSIRASVASMPLDRILTETDGPFTNTNGRPSVPSDVSSTLTGLAFLLQSDFASLRSQIATNLRNLEA